MKNTRLTHILLISLLAGSPVLTASDPDAHTDTTQRRADYPYRLLTEFPVIYADTALVTPQYNIVIRAVWMSRRGRRCKVTSPGQLPEPPGAMMIRFIHDPAYDTARFHTDAIVIHRK